MALAVSEYLKLGGTRSDLAHDLKKGIVTVKATVLDSATPVRWRQTRARRGLGRDATTWRHRGGWERTNRWVAHEPRGHAVGYFAHPHDVTA